MLLKPFLALSALHPLPQKRPHAQTVLSLKFAESLPGPNGWTETFQAVLEIGKQWVMLCLWEAVRNQFGLNAEPPPRLKFPGGKQDKLSDLIWMAAIASMPISQMAIVTSITKWENSAPYDLFEPIILN